VSAGIFGVVLGSILATRGLPDGEVALLTLLHAISVMSFMFSWNALNDLLDIEIDRVNHPERPLPSGDISLEAARKGIFLTGLGSILSLSAAGFVATTGETGFEGWAPALAIWGFALILLFHYESPSKFSFRMKDKGLPGNVAISLSVGLVIVFGAAGVSKPLDARAWSVFVIGFLYNLSREIVKDIEDLEGDKGRNTLAMSVGEDRARVIAWAILLMTLLALLAPFLPSLNLFLDWHVVFIIPALVSLLMVKARLFSSEDHSAQVLIKNSMQLCLAAFLVISLIPN
tara:strand:- start:1975 stop:2835 length:861 start_codon:yes stop_codon:yes gene_type:complete